MQLFIVKMSVPNRPTEYSYNTTGNLVGVTSPNGLARTYTRDAADRLTGVTADEKNFAYEYYGDGLIKSITYPGGNIVTTYTYDNANRITKLETKNGSNVLKTYSYKYDDVGNITSVSGSESAVYTYDELNRLKTATENGYTVTYEYDNRNNLISETRDDGYVKTYEYSGDNRLTKTTENGTETLYEYDLNGNLIKRGDDEFAYDSNDKLVYSKVNGVESVYEIGEDGLRRAKITSGITTTYSIDENGNVITEGNDEIIIGNVPLAKKIDGQYYYYIYNAHGDVVMIVDESGNIKNTYRYDAWGAIVSETETINNSHKYAGQYYDDDTGLIYLRARYYDPQDRRFTQEDPARDELNWYAYCGNNPVMFVDPSGLDAIVLNQLGNVGGMGHMSAFVQDDSDVWYFFYWGNNSVSLTKVDDPTILSDEVKINEWLEDNGLSDGKYEYDGFCYILGDFSSSKDYYQKLVDQYNSDIANEDFGWVGWKNKNYNFVTRNCTQETMKGLYRGKIGVNGDKSVKEIHNESGYCIAVVPNSNLYNLQKVYGSKTLNWWE